MIAEALIATGLSAGLGLSNGSSGAGFSTVPAVGPWRPSHKEDASVDYVFGLSWRRPVVRVGRFRTVAASFGQPGISLAHDTVVVAQGEGRVKAFALHDGALRWEYRTEAPFETSVSVVPRPRTRTESKNPGWGPEPELALVCARDGVLTAFDVKNGSSVWTSDLEIGARAPPRVAGQLAVFSTPNNRVHAVDLASGTIRWRQGRSRPEGLTVHGHARPAVFAGVVFAAYSDGYLEAYRLEDGSRLWSRPLALQGSGFRDADADLLVLEGRLYAASYSDGVYALDLETGDTIWKRSASAVTSLAGSGNRVIAASADGYVWGLRAEDGEPVFRTRFPSGPVSRMTVQAGLIAFSAGDSGLIVLRADSGQPLQATATGGRAGGAPAWRGRSLAFLSSAGYLYVAKLGEAGLIE